MIAREFSQEECRDEGLRRPQEFGGGSGLGGSQREGSTLTSNGTAVSIVVPTLREAATKRRFSRDLLNLTLASPSVNRYQKGAVAVRQAYQLTIDRREADAIDRILAGCPSTGTASRGLD